MAGVKYFLIKENWMEDWPCALVGADDKDKELLKFLEKHQIEAKIHVINGSVEIAPNIGLAGAISTEPLMT